MMSDNFRKKRVVKNVINKIPYHQFWINIDMINKKKVIDKIKELEEK